MMKILLIIFLSLFCTFSYGQTNGVLVQSKNYDGIIFNADHKLSIHDTVKRWTPNESDIAFLEKNLKTYMEKQLRSTLYNQGGKCPIIAKNLKRYTRQYAGYFSSKGEKMIFVNCFWDKEDPFNKDWKNKLIQVFDGCSYYWHITFNLNNQELVDYSINGVG